MILRNHVLRPESFTPNVGVVITNLFKRLGRCDVEKVIARITEQEMWSRNPRADKLKFEDLAREAQRR